MPASVPARIRLGENPDSASPVSDSPPALLVDLYELTMARSYVAEGIAESPATFELFFRRLPPGWGYLLAAGLDDVLSYLARLRFEPDELDWLEGTGLFDDALLARLERLRFSGDVRAMPEGTAFFPHEPVLEVTGPLLEAQLVETVVLNLVHHQSLVAGKAARSVDVADGRRLVEFGLRRTHGGEAGLKAARSAWLAGFDSTSNVLAGQRYGIPVAGTMAHSHVEAFEDETAAFEAYVRSYPDGATLLVDTYDTVEGARRAARVARDLAARGGRLAGVRLDSGDLLDLSHRVRRVLDDAGLPDVTIFASGGLGEEDVARLLADGAPIDGFGIGSKLGVSVDAPFLDMAYKLVSFDGRPVLKLSAGKATLPGSKQVWRRSEAGLFAGDVIALAAEDGAPGAEPLLRPAMTGGERAETGTLEEARARAAAQRAALAPDHRRLDAAPYPVEVSSELDSLREVVGSRLRMRSGDAAQLDPTGGEGQ
jgi:nicotinate phosphoribosyltransferase